MLKRVIILILGAMLVAPTAPAIAAQGDANGSGGVPISGVIRPGSPVLHVDAVASWLLDRELIPSDIYQRTRVGDLAGFRFDPIQPWQVGPLPRVLHWDDERYAGMVMWSDEQMCGQLMTAWTTDEYPAANGTDAEHRVAVHLATPFGAWSGTLVGFGHGARGLVHLDGMLEGSGSYAGRTSRLQLTQTGPDADWAVEGVIFDAA